MPGQEILMPRCSRGRRGGGSVKKSVFCSILIAFVLVSISSGECADLRKNSITVIFRYDDYSSRSSTEIERRLIDVFREKKVGCTFGVIPFVCAGPPQDEQPQQLIPLSASKIGILREGMQDGTLDVALHGCSHQTAHEKNFLRKYSEYAGVSYNAQLESLHRGKTFLEKELGTSVGTFIPPWSTYDIQTIRALENLDFNCISAYLSSYAPEYSTLKMVPGTCNLAQLPKVLKYAGEIIDYNPVISVVFHDYEFREIGYRVEGEEQVGFDEFRDILGWITSQPDIQVKSIRQVLESGKDFSANRFINNKYYMRLAHLKPDFWPPRHGVYLDSETAYGGRIRDIFRGNVNSWKLINLISVAAFYLIILGTTALFSWLFGVMVLRSIPGSGRLYHHVKSTFMALSISTCVCLLFFQHLEYKIMVLIIGAAGGLLGLWLGLKPEQPGNNALVASGRESGGPLIPALRLHRIHRDMVKSDLDSKREGKD